MPVRRIGAAIAIVVLLFALARTEQRRGRLGVVLVDRLCERLLDGASSRKPPCSRSSSSSRPAFSGRTRRSRCGSRHRPRPRVPAAFAPSFVTFQSSRGPWAQPSGLQPSPSGVASRHPGRRAHPRTADRPGREQPVGPRPPVPLSDALRPERSAVRQGHRLLPLLAAGLRRDQELALLAAGALRSHGRRDLLRARRRRSRSSALERFAGRDRPRLRAARRLFRGQGLGLRPRPLPPALRRQRGRRRRRLHRCSCRAAGALAADRPRRRRRPRRVRQHQAALGAPRHRGGVAGVRRRFRVWRSRPCPVSALLCQAERAAAGDAVHSAEHRSHPGGLQPRPDHGETVPRGAGSDLSVAARRQRDGRQHPALGLAAAARRLRATAGDPHLLPVSRRRRRSLPSRRLLSAGDALGARARPFAAAGQRPDLGQSASPVHPWRRRGHVAGHPQIRRGPADLLPEGHPAGRRRRSSDH